MNTPVSATALAPMVRVGLWRRGMCLLYEALIGLCLLLFFGYAFSALTRFTGQSGLIRTVFQLWLAGVLGVYFSWSWSQGRCSLPMKTLSLRVVCHARLPISQRRAWGRYLLALVMAGAPLALQSVWGPRALLLLALIPLCAAVDPLGRTPYDWLSGTRLVRIPDPPA